MLLTKDKYDFLNLCYQFADLLEEVDANILGTDCKGKLYEDDVIDFSISSDRNFVEIIRKAEDTHIILSQNGNIMLFDRDFIFLIDHIKDLISKHS